MDNTQQQTWADWGLKAEAVELPFFDVTSKPKTIRIVEKLNTPATIAQGGTARFETLARFKVEDDEGRFFLLDVLSKRLFSQLLATVTPHQWFTICKTGSGYGTLYTVTPQ